MRNLVKPQLLKGFRDCLPAQMIARQRIVDVIRRTYELYGFVPLETPALEYLETLLGYGEEASKQIFQFTDLEDRRVGLRFDLTVPLARVVSQYRELPRPFKRYQVSPVWRFDKPGAGRFREFVQFDIDTVGSSSMEADAELIAATCDVLAALKIPRFCVRFSNRKVLNGLVPYAAIPPDRAASVFKVIDKLDRIGLDNARLELAGGRADVSGDRITGVGLDAGQIERVNEFLTVPKGNRAETLDAASRLLAGVAGTEEGIAELRQIHDCLCSMGVGDDKAYVDLNVARGLDYYTGPVFEAILPDKPEFGSVMGGGRYDSLVERFSDESIPATGASIGVDRLLAAMESMGLLGQTSTTAQVLVTVMDPARMADYRGIARELRQAGLCTELYLGTEKSLRKQLQYCDRQGIPIAVIAGSDEFSQNAATIKDMRRIETVELSGADRKSWLAARVGQSSTPRGQLTETIRAALAGPGAPGSAGSPPVGGS